MYTNNKIKIGIISSSGGAVFKEMCKLNEFVDFLVVTDRECGIEKVCQVKNIPFIRIAEKENRIFSKEALKYFTGQRTNGIVLFFTRFVSREIFQNFPTFNIHPSFLPAFSGLNPIPQAIQAQVKFIGATLHLVDNTMDNGTIIAQVVNAINNYNGQYLNKISFLQKTILSYLLIDLFISAELIWSLGTIKIERKSGGNEHCNPFLKNKKIIDIFRKIEKENKMKIL